MRRYLGAVPERATATCPTCGAVAEATDEPMYVAYVKGPAPERTPGTDLAWCGACEAPFEVARSAGSGE